MRAPRSLGSGQMQPERTVAPTLAGSRRCRLLQPTAIDCREELASENGVQISQMAVSQGGASF